MISTLTAREASKVSRAIWVKKKKRRLLCIYFSDMLQVQLLKSLLNFHILFTLGEERLSKNVLTQHREGKIQESTEDTLCCRLYFLFIHQLIWLLNVDLL